MIALAGTIGTVSLTMFLQRNDAHASRVSFLVLGRQLQMEDPSELCEFVDIIATNNCFDNW
jgi:putative Ca2+/H+ antiporter (TMEM165/GDT1 family)